MYKRIIVLPALFGQVVHVFLGIIDPAVFYCFRGLKYVFLQTLHQQFLWINSLFLHRSCKACSLVSILVVVFVIFRELFVSNASVHNNLPYDPFSKNLYLP